MAFCSSFIPRSGSGLSSAAQLPLGDVDRTSSRSARLGRLPSRATLGSRGTTSREPAARSEAVASGFAPLLSARAEHLIKEQIETPIFDSSLLPSPFAEACQAAQEEGRFLDAEELNNLGGELLGVVAAGTLRDSVEMLVGRARRKVNEVHKGITGVGGALYPEFRATACWRDFWHFVRVVSYGVAAETSAFTGAEGMRIMKEIYKELGVPLDAMITGLNELKIGAMDTMKSEKEKEVVGAAFVHLIDRLSSFRQ